MILIPRLQKVSATETSYLKRATTIYAYETVVKLYPKELQGPCLQEVFGQMKDKVPNIRIVSLKVLSSLFRLVDDTHRQIIRSSAQGFTQDIDQDVRQLAQFILGQ